MARINFEDDVEAQDEFWTLLPLLGGDRERALGKLLRFFRLAQKAWGYDQPMTAEELQEKGFSDMIESGWAVPVAGGFHSLGADKHFAWYRQKVEAGKMGGRPKKEEADPDSGENRSVLPDNRSGPPANPLALAPVPAPVPVPVQKKENTSARARDEVSGQGLDIRELAEVIEAWAECLQHRGQDRKLFPGEDAQLGGFLIARGKDAALLAILGMKYEPSDEGYKSSRHVHINRLIDPKKFPYFVGLGAQAKKQLAEKASHRPAPADPPRGEDFVDPEKIRALIASAFPAMPK